MAVIAGDMAQIDGGGPRSGRLAKRDPAGKIAVVDPLLPFAPRCLFVFVSNRLPRHSTLIFTGSEIVQLRGVPHAQSFWI